MNYELYGSSGTADFYSENGIHVRQLTFHTTVYVSTDVTVSR